MNGKLLPEESREMNATIAYLDWLSKSISREAAVPGKSPFDPPGRMADRENGKEMYSVFRQSCHGKTGTGFKAISESEGDANAFIAPACGLVRGEL